MPFTAKVARRFHVDYSVALSDTPFSFVILTDPSSLALQTETGADISGEGSTGIGRLRALRVGTNAFHATGVLST